MKYLLGANYWGRDYGTEMWRHYDGKKIREELKLLADYGIRDLRVFPNWRDFQPVARTLGVFGIHGEYVNLNTGAPVYDDGVDTDQIENFRDFCHAAEENGMRLVVSIVTGWMSGRLFCPPALEGKNLLTDPEVLMWTRRYVHRFVKELKNEKAIVMWDLGNECNCLARANNVNEAYAWTATVTDAIRCEDKTRPISSGMHGIVPNGNCAPKPWRIEHQAELCDVLTPHPYPSPTVEGDKEPYNRLRMTYLPTAQSLFYSGISGKDTYVQESGVFSETIGNRKMAQDFLRINVLSTLVNGMLGYQWWCAWEQNHMDYSPYSWSMIERELGLFDKDYQPKPVATEMKKIREAIEKLPSPFPMRVADGVCIPSRDTNEQNVAIGSLIIAKQAGLDLNIAFSNNGTLPDSKIYFLSSVTGWQVLYKSTWDNLIKRVEGGASLVISFAGGQITSFTTLVGAESNGFIGNAAHTVKIGEHTISYTAKTILLSPTTAEVLLRDTNGEPVLLKNKVGKGYVYFINFNVEDQAFNSPDGFNKQPFYLIYREICRELLSEKIIRNDDPNLGLTVNPTGDGEYVVTVLNYSDTCRRNDTVIKDGYMIKEILYGSGEVIPACDGLILKIQKSE